MNKILLALLLSSSFSALASERASCEIKGSLSSFGSSMGIRYHRPVELEECLERGREMFEGTVDDGVRIINPLKNSVTVKSWTTQYKQVKIIHRSESGMKTVERLKRDSVEKGPVQVKVIKVESGFRCWTKDECIPLE
jgi:hypothetical protein